MNCIIVDDDEMSRSTVQHFVEQTEFLKLKGNCSSASEAIQLLKTEQIHLVFLDIEMPQMSGLEMLETLEVSPYIIFITSKRDYAVEAFEHNVVDYLLKPLKYVRFIKAVNKVMDLVRVAKTTTFDITEDDIFVKSELKYVRIRFKEVCYIEAMADYVVLYLKDSKHIIHSTMKGIEKKIPLDSFVRIHRSYIVNQTKIEQVENANVIINAKRLPIGASYKNDFMSKLKIL
jgi:DNA-binding LytR/AlgR family response regulator